MIVVVNVWTVPADKMQEAVAFLKRFGDIAGKKSLGVKYSIMKPVSGELAKVHQVNKFPSFAVRDEYLKQRDASPEYAKLMKEAFDRKLFEGAPKRFFYEEID